jgi:hypothetical protein
MTSSFAPRFMAGNFDKILNCQKIEFMVAQRLHTSTISSCLGTGSGRDDSIPGTKTMPRLLENMEQLTCSQVQRTRRN